MTLTASFGKSHQKLIDKMKIIPCNYTSHAIDILNILNESILNSTALYDYQPRTIESMIAWFKTKEAHHFPVIGAIDSQNKLIGFSTYGTFRPQPAFKYTIEHSIYIHQDHRGQGLGRSLLEQLITTAQAQEYHTIIGAIDMTNTTSIALHQKLGFTHTGTINQAGFKFGQWLDLGFYQLRLATPSQPIDG
jgi:L-amino acid N-acyltransferase